MTRVSRMPPDVVSTASPSPLPIPYQKEVEVQENGLAEQVDAERTKNQLCPHARLRIHLDDVSHAATGRFTNLVPLSTILEEAILNVQQQLFTKASPNANEGLGTQRPPQKPIKPRPTWGPQEVRSVTLHLRDMGGVAYTTGSQLDEAHKEIHLSLAYVEAQSGKSNADFLHEMRGVITHEMVHAFQHNAKGTCPGGFIEGIADYVRMGAGLGAKHWKKFPANEDTRGKAWDEGYQKTAFFLEWLEEKCASKVPHVIGELNHAMQSHKWDDGKLFEKVTGLKVEKWWDKYKEEWKNMSEMDS